MDAQRPKDWWRWKCYWDEATDEEKANVMRGASMTDIHSGNIRMSALAGCQTPNGTSCIEIYNGKEWQVMHSSWHHIYRFMMDYFEIESVDAEQATKDFLDQMGKLGIRVMP